jgi:hypothetical protein
MNAAADPNWLLSSAAQSAAALVAIVGGFLAARVIAFNSDRDAAVRRSSITGRDLQGWMNLEATAKAELDERDQKSPKEPKQRAELKSRLSESQERVVRLIMEQDQIQRELAAMEFPADVGFGFGVLFNFALLGVVLPIILMATQPEDVSLLWRIVVVIGFLLGLLGLAVFLDSITGTAEGRQRWSWLRGRFGK